MNTDTALKNYRLNQWAALIQERSQSGLTVRQFCIDRNLTKNSYYYWQRKVRDDLVESAGDAPQFVELTKNLSATKPLPKTFSETGDRKRIFAFQCLQYAHVLSGLSKIPDSVWKIDMVSLL